MTEHAGFNAFWAVKWAESVADEITIPLLSLQNLATELRLWQQHMEVQWT